MHVLFGTQDVLDLINDCYTPVAENETEAQINMLHETRMKDQKIFFYIYQWVDMKVF